MAKFREALKNLKKLNYLKMFWKPIKKEAIKIRPLLFYFYLNFNTKFLLI